MRLSVALLLIVATFVVPLVASINIMGINTSVERVSITPASGASNGNSDNLSFSEDGRYVAFESRASNLVAGDSNGAPDVFVRDLQTDVTIRVSIATAGTQGNAASFSPMISADGDFVVFASLANNLVAGDVNGCTDIFLRDIQNNTTTRMSVGVSALEADGCSDSPSVSEDGSLVGFRSAATNLVGSSDTNGKIDFFVRDVAGGTNALVSVSTAGVQGNDDSLDGKISASGDFFAFSSKATNLVSGDANLCSDVFVRDIVNSTTEVISKSSGGTIGNRSSEEVDISSDGRYVVFSSRAANLVTGDSNGYPDIFLRDRNLSTTERVSFRNGSAQSRSESRNPQVSDDGTFVVFENAAGDLQELDSNNVPDAYVRDRRSQLTTFFSSSSVGTIGNKWSKKPAISADGTTFGFSSAATNIVGSDANERTDLFVRPNQILNQAVNVTIEGTVTENGGEQDAFRFHRYGDTTNPLVVTYTVSGSAVAGTDYEALSGTVTIPALSSSVVVPVEMTGDTIVEPNETIVVEITQTSTVLPAGFPKAELQIPNDDLFIVSFTLTSNMVTENGATRGSFTISRTGGTYGDLYVNVGLGGTATSGLDYSGIASVVMIPAGQSSIDFEITGISDLLVESEETIDLTIASGAGYVSGSPSAISITIKDENTNLISVMALDSVAMEGDSGNKAVFRISRMSAIPQSLAVNYVLRGTAMNGLDYQFLTGVATIASGQAYVDVEISADADVFKEGIETVQLELLEGPLYILGDSSAATVLIADLNSIPILSVSVVDGVASEDGTNTASFRVTRAGSTAGALTVYYSLGGQAKNSLDYSVTPVPLIIANGQSTADLTVTGIEDSAVEETENVVLALSSSTNYEIDLSAAKGSLIIFDNDIPLVSVFVRSTFSTETGDKTGAFVVRRKGDISGTLSVDVSLSGTATSGSDYSSVSSPILFAAGQSEAIVPIVAISDAAIEGPEHVKLNLVSGSGYTISSDAEARVGIIDRNVYVFENIFGLLPNGDIREVSVSDDGRYVTFSSTASNLVSGDTNGRSDVFIADLQTPSIHRIMGLSGQEPNGASSEPKMSADGRYFVFTTKASNFFINDINQVSDIVLFDRTLGTSTYVSKGFTTLSEGGDSFKPSISSNGNWVVFASSAKNLVGTDLNDSSDIFLYNRLSGQLSRVNNNTTGWTFYYNCSSPSVSNDGARVAFEYYDNIGSNGVRLSRILSVEISTGVVTVISRQDPGPSCCRWLGTSTKPMLSADGDMMTFESESSIAVEDSNRSADIYVIKSGETYARLASVSQGGGPGDRPSRFPAVSKNGQYVSFVTSARNLTPETNCTTTTMINDLKSGHISPVAYQTALKCEPPLVEAFITSNGKLTASTRFVSSGIREILLAPNPTFY